MMDGFGFGGQVVAEMAEEPVLLGGGPFFQLVESISGGSCWRGPDGGGAEGGSGACGEEAFDGMKGGGAGVVGVIIEETTNVERDGPCQHLLFNKLNIIIRYRE